MQKFFLINFSLLDYALPYQLGFQDPASPIMVGIIQLHHHIMFFLVIILCFVFCMIYFCLISFSIYENNDIQKFLKIKNFYNVKLNHNSILEIIWTIIPTIILLIIAIPSFALLYGSEISMDSNISVKIIGHQWYWSYECFILLKKSFTCFPEMYNNLKINFDSYMLPLDDLKNNDLRLLEVTNPLVLPINTYIKLYVTSSDVLHSWAVPSLGIKIDAVPGRLNEVMCFINRIGRFYGQCSEICGVNHGFMPIAVYGVSYNDFLLYCLSVNDDIFFQLLQRICWVEPNFRSFFLIDGFMYVYNWWYTDAKLWAKFIESNLAASFVVCVRNY